MRVRARTADDLDGCVQLAELVHRKDGYPPYLPTDLRTFLVSPDALAAWVAEGDGERPVLDVVTEFGGAVRLYEDNGWVRAGQITFRADDGTAFEEFVYLGPAPCFPLITGNSTRYSDRHAAGPGDWCAALAHDVAGTS